MSQIFEALRRSREQDRHERPPKPTAQADAVLATLGFASERKPTPRERFAPLVLFALLLVGAWLGWRWYAGAPTRPLAQLQPAPAPASSAPRPRPAAPPRQAPPAVQTPAPAAVTTSAPAAPVPSPGVPVRQQTTDAPVETPRKPVTGKKPGTPDPFQLALYFHRAGDFENALMHYRAVLQSNALNPQAHNNLGLLYRDKGLLDDAVREFQRALLIDGRYMTARNNLGVALLGLGRLDEAAGEFRQVLAQAPRDVDAMVNLALVEKSAGRPGVAMETLARALGIEPRSAPAHYNLAVLYEQSGETGRAAEHYRAFLDHAGPQHAARMPEVRARLAELAKRAARETLR